MEYSFTLSGKDAVILTNYMGIDHICIAQKVCKCAIPVDRIEKFCRKLKERRISYVLYDYIPENSHQKPQIRVISRVTLEPIYESKENMNCDKCPYYEKFKQIQEKKRENFKKWLGRMNGKK